VADGERHECEHREDLEVVQDRVAPEQQRVLDAIETVLASEALTADQKRIRINAVG